MARIVGVDLPSNKRGEIALTYIYGIGRSSANYRNRVQSRRRAAFNSSDEHQEVDGYRVLPWYSSSSGTSCERSEYKKQCPYT